MFATPKDVKELYAKLDTITEDVCILANIVNIVGIWHYNLIHDISVNISFMMVNFNVNAKIFISRFFITKFKKRFDERKLRSAVINLSSAYSIVPSA